MACLFLISFCELDYTLSVPAGFSPGNKMKTVQLQLLPCPFCLYACRIEA